MPWEVAGAKAHVRPQLAVLDQLPAEGVLVELHLPGCSLQQLHDSRGSALSDVLSDLHRELSRVAGVGTMQLRIVGIHERFQRSDAPSLRHSQGEKVRHSNQEVVVCFRVLTQEGSHSPKRALHALQADLAQSSGTLKGGKFSDVMQNATITENVTSAFRIPRREEDSLHRMSAMALPIGISAAFTGILIWLAAW